ncbi:VanW family protein [Candidatus Gottesmanbacteria bacterium]|nr:VanW family protein [Candidatus Gottesmanbacteria bacterium]
MKNNILLNLAYLSDKVTSKKDLNWEEVIKPFQYEFKLDPGKTFSFHDDVLTKYKNSLVKTTNAHFNAGEGFKTDGYLFGDGVCHLASLINWVAKDAGLEVEAPTSHDFANIPDVPREYGVSIYSNPYSAGSNTRQNLYITNNKGKSITFKFAYQNNKVKVSVVELN